MASEITLLVLRAALFTSLAIILILGARRLLRRWLGAAAAYLAWLVVPLVAVAALLPSDSAPVLLQVAVLAPAQALAAHALPVAPTQVDWLLLAWVAGMAAMAAWFVLAHGAFLRRAGRLTRRGGLYVSSADVGPASVGLFRPRIVVPHDFALRYSPSEQALVIAHEHTHIARRDAWANLLAAAFQCAFWFNPLVHVGVRCLRHDQELACDAAVMQQHPHQRRTYAEALLKCHTGAPAIGAGINCHWQNHHPTRERLMSLQQNPPGTVRRYAGRCAVALLALGALGATLGVRAEQATATPAYAVSAEAHANGAAARTYYGVAFDVDANGERWAPRVLTQADERFSVASGEWRIEMTVRPGPAPDQVWLAGKLSKAGAVVSAPTLLARFNEKATIKVGDGDQVFSLTMVVSPQS